MGFQIANEPAADQVLDEYPFAVVVGMMLDQQYGMEHAFRGGWKVLSRFGTLDPAAIAAADPEAFKALCSPPPAIHRFPGSMAARLQELAALVESSTTATSRGSGPRRQQARSCSSASRSFPASASRRRRSSWRCWPSSSACDPGAGRRSPATTRSTGYRSVADVVDATRCKVREYKQAKKASAKAAQEA